MIIKLFNKTSIIIMM